MLSSVWAARWYIFLGTVTFLLTLLITTPLHFVWQYVSPFAQQLPVQISQPVGTLWQGSAQIRDRSLGEFDAEWTITQPLSLLTGNLNLHVAVDGGPLRLTGQTHIGGLWQGTPSQVTFTDLDGYMDADLLSPVLAPQQVSLDGNFELSGLNAAISLQDQQLLNVSGQLVYSGGQVTYPLQRGKTQTAELPMLIATAETLGDNILLPVVTDAGEPIGEAYLQPDGWGGVRVLRRAIDIAGQTWPDKQADEDTVVFEVSQKVM